MNNYWNTNRMSSQDFIALQKLIDIAIQKELKLKEEVRREKNEAQLRHEEKVFGK